MGSKTGWLFIVLALIAGFNQVAAQGTRFFRIFGPAATTITAFRPDGTLVWSNAQPDATYTVQTVSSLTGGSNWLDYVQIPTTNKLNNNLLIDFSPPAGMTLIPAGSFTMGNSIGDSDITDASPTNVTVSAFYMDVNLVSLGQWQSVYDWATNNGYGFLEGVAGKATNHPVQTVLWWDCVRWCNARSQQATLTPVYYTDSGLTQVYTNGAGTIYVDWAANGYRLPTEAEWEKAARGGLNARRFPSGYTISGAQANHLGSPFYSYDLGPNGYNASFATGGFPYTSPVGYFAANGYGLYDLAGNVFEWCWDWYGPVYAGGNDPRGPASGSARVLRGGSWNDYADFSRCAFRNSSTPGVANYYLGFRCVRRL